MKERCEQGDAMEKTLQDFILDTQKSQAKDRLEHQKTMGDTATAIAVQSVEVTNLIKTSIEEMKACKKERGEIHKRINKIWTTGVAILMIIIGWLYKAAH